MGSNALAYLSKIELNKHLSNNLYNISTTKSLALSLNSLICSIVTTPVRVLISFSTAKPRLIFDNGNKFFAEWSNSLNCFPMQQASITTGSITISRRFLMTAFKSNYKYGNHWDISLIFFLKWLSNSCSITKKMQYCCYEHY